VRTVRDQELRAVLTRSSSAAVYPPILSGNTECKHRWLSLPPPAAHRLCPALCQMMRALFISPTTKLTRCLTTETARLQHQSWELYLMEQGTCFRKTTHQPAGRTQRGPRPPPPSLLCERSSRPRPGCKLVAPHARSAAEVEAKPPDAK
jgi:hypothetical protein